VYNADKLFEMQDKEQFKLRIKQGDRLYLENGDMENMTVVRNLNTSPESVVKSCLLLTSHLGLRNGKV